MSRQPKERRGGQELHHGQQARARAKSAERARAAFDKAMAAAIALDELLEEQHHDSTLAEHLPALEHHLNAVYQDVLLMERDARAEYQSATTRNRKVLSALAAHATTGRLR